MRYFCRKHGNEVMKIKAFKVCLKKGCPMLKVHYHFKKKGR